MLSKLTGKGCDVLDEVICHILQYLDARVEAQRIQQVKLEIRGRGVRTCCASVSRFSVGSTCCAKSCANMAMMWGWARHFRVHASMPAACSQAGSRSARSWRCRLRKITKGLDSYEYPTPTSEHRMIMIVQVGHLSVWNLSLCGSCKLVHVRSCSLVLIARSLKSCLLALAVHNSCSERKRSRSTKSRRPDRLLPRWQTSQHLLSPPAPPLTHLLHFCQRALSTMRR